MQQPPFSFQEGRRRYGGFSWEIFLGCRPLVPLRALNCFYSGPKGKYGSVHWTVETCRGSLVSGTTKALWRPALKPFLCAEVRARDSTQDAFLSKPVGVIWPKEQTCSLHSRRGWDLEDSWKLLLTGQSSGLFSPHPGRTWSAQLS